MPAASLDTPLARADGCKGVVLDIGCNNGTDTLAWLERGYCVLAVDANPLMVAETATKGERFGARLRVLTAGLDEETRGSQQFWIADDPAHSSFDKRSATRNGRARPQPVPTVDCASVLRLPTERPYFAKIDIEERHFVCVEAFKRLDASRLPSYVSWERHHKEHERALPALSRARLPFPLLDAKLLLEMQALGYRWVKVSAGHGMSFTSSGDESPEELLDSRTKSAAWLSVPNLFLRGLSPGARASSWHDYVMKRDDGR